MPRRKKSEHGIETDRFYFTEATEDAIVRYNESECTDERETIFRNEIAYPLDKMAENVINRFKFPYIKENFEPIKQQVVSFLVVNLHKYSKDKGKAFSYFSVISKNYLIFHNNNSYKEEKRSLYLSDSGEDVVPLDDVVANLEAPNEHQHDDVKEFVALLVEYWENNVTRHFKKRRDIDIANAVIELFRRSHNIENFNKKALYLMIREMTDCKTGYITKVVNKMKVIIADQMQEFYSQGTINQDKTEIFRYR